MSRTHTSFSLCFQVDVIQNRPRSEHAKMRRIRGTVSHFSLYFQLVGLAAEIRTVHETEDYGGVICTRQRAPLMPFLPTCGSISSGKERVAF